MPERKFKVIPAVLVIALLTVIGLVAYELVELNRPISRPPLPNPNGYDDFVKGGRQRTSDPHNFGTMTLDQLRALVATNAEALQIVRRGLTKPSHVPLTFSPTNLDAHLATVARFKDLAQLLVAEGRLAEQEQRTNDAVRIYLDEIRFAHECCRGGVIIDKLVGISCESIGTTALRQLAGGLDAKSAHEGAKTLEQIESHREPLPDTFRNEKEWAQKNFSLLVRVPPMIFNPSQNSEAKLTAKAQNIELGTKQLIIDLAARAYELDHGRHPENLSALVPDYLDSIPVDPTTGTNLTYLP